MNSRAIADITNFIFMDDPLEKSDIILIPGSSRAEIAEKTARLYHVGVAPYILPSGKFPSSRGRFIRQCDVESPYRGDYATEFEFIRRVLLDNGVPESAILREDCATNSMENAMYSAAVVKSLGLTVRRGIICCKAYHARRAFLSYACHFPDCELLMAPVEVQGVTRDHWHQAEGSFRLVMGELAKCGAYFSDSFIRPADVAQREDV